MPSFFWSILATLALFSAGGQNAAEIMPALDEEDTASGPSLSPDAEKARQISLERVIIIRIPRAQRVPDSAAAHSADAASMECLPLSSIAATYVSGPATLDLVAGNRRYRAYLPTGCDARQFYSGFYIEKPEDGRFCVRREELHARSGTVCRIERIVALGH